MCTACVAQGVAYVGGAAGILRLMAARAASARRADDRRGGDDDGDGTSPEGADGAAAVPAPS